MSREAKMTIGWFELVQMVPQQHAARQVGAREASARIAQRKQMMREIAVRPDVRQAVRRSRVRRVPSILGDDS